MPSVRMPRAARARRTASPWRHSSARACWLSWASRQVCAFASVYEGTPDELKAFLTRRRAPTVGQLAAQLLAAAALVSVYATLELLRQDPSFKEPAKPGILLAVLAVMLPLALRRRFPLAVACTAPS